MPKKLKVDKNLCIACQSCVAAYPGYFQIGADGKSEFIGEAMDDTQAEAAKAVCPVGAIQDDISN